MINLGDKAAINENDKSDEKNFIPKSHSGGNKVEYYEYENLYEKDS